MEEDRDLFGKTFDQQLKIAGSEIVMRGIAPNRRIPGEIVFEPLYPSGVRVTARDEEHRVLWGYVGAKGTVKQIHCLVADLRHTASNSLAVELQKLGMYCPEAKDPVAAATAALDAIEDTVKWLRNSLEVQDVSEATLERARSITQIVSDANRQITLEANSLRGMKKRRIELGEGGPGASLGHKSIEITMNILRSRSARDAGRRRGEANILHG